MRTQYVTHACLFHEFGADHILSDPWFQTPAYLNQWHVFPQPKDESVLERANAILISHGHEDHLHVDTLSRANKDAHLLYPRQPDGDASGFFGDVLGFKKHYHELKGNRPFQLPGGTTVFPVPVGHDCIYVLKQGDYVLANINDALHSASAELIERVCAWLNKRFPRIDAVFCGFGGASYFPNCFHHPSKDDRKIAVVREALFARNFCLIAARLAPKVAIPFAADFHLRHEALQWINETRFARTRMPDLFAQLFPEATAATTVLPLEPGQWLEEDGSVTGTPAAGPDPEFTAYRGTKKSLDAIGADYVQLLNANLAKQPLPSVALPLGIEIVTDQASSWIAIEGGAGSQRASQVDAAPESVAVRARIGADSVEYLLGLEWHSDIIVIGYGMEFFLDEGVRPTVELVHALGDLVTHYPKVKRDLAKKPLRTLSWVRDNHQARHVIASKLGRKGSSNFTDASLGEWLAMDADALAKQLRIPPEFCTV